MGIVKIVGYDIPKLFLSWFGISMPRLDLLSVLQDVLNVSKNIISQSMNFEKMDKLD